MKNWKLLPLVLVLGFYACQDSDDMALDEGLIDSELTESLLSAETSSESTYEEIDLAVDESFEFSFEDGASGRVESERDKNRKGIHGRRLWKSRHFGEDCAEVEHDTTTNTIIIDFGDGCEGRNGVVRSGKIIITYSEEQDTIDAWKSVTFEDFFVDSVQVEGVKTHTIIAIDENGNKTTLSTLVGGKMTFPDGTFATRDSEKTRFRFRGETLEDSYATVFGWAEGANAEGVAYTMNIDESELLLFQGGCFEDGKGFIPVSGIKTITKGEDVIILNYGDGECDNLVTATVNGETKVYELTGRGRKVVRG